MGNFKVYTTFNNNLGQTAPSAWKCPKTQFWGPLTNWKFGPSPRPHTHSYPCDWGPPGPILTVGWGSRRELGAPHTFLTDSSVCLRDGRPSAYGTVVNASAIKQVPKMPNHQCIMEETEMESRFTNCDIFAYVKDGKYPADYTNDEKHPIATHHQFHYCADLQIWKPCSPDHGPMLRICQWALLPTIHVALQFTS